MEGGDVAQNGTTRMLRVALIIAGVVELAYGLGFALIPGLLVQMNGSPQGIYRWKFLECGCSVLEEHSRRTSCAMPQWALRRSYGRWVTGGCRGERTTWAKWGW